MARDHLSRSNFWIIVLNSTAYFMLSYFLVLFIKRFTYAITTVASKLSLTVFNSGITYNVVDTDWTFQSVRLIFSSGTIAVFLLLLIFMVIYYLIREYNTSIKFFLIWGMIHSANMTFGGIFNGIVIEAEFFHYLRWMFISMERILIVSILAALLLSLMAYLITKPVLFSANVYFKFIEKDDFPYYSIAAIGLPFILGTASSLIYLGYYADRIDLFNFLSLMYMVILIIIFIQYHRNLYFEEYEEIKIFPRYYVLIASLLIYGFSWYLLYDGITFA